MTQITLNGKDPLVDWYERHQLEYAMTEKRLAATKAKFMSVPFSQAVDMHNKLFVWSVVSQQNDTIDIQADFDLWANKDVSMKEAFFQTNYGGMHISWITDTFSDMDTVAEGVKLLRNGKPHEYKRFAAEHFKGVSYIKAPYTACHLGFTDLMCLDTNVSQFLGVDTYTVEGWEDQEDICQQVDESLDMDIPPFVKQWCVFDYQRGYHEPHKPIFQAVDTWEELDRSL